MTKALFDAVRVVKGSALTQDDVDLINRALAPAAAREDEPDPELIAQLKIDEGCRLTAYKDTVGVWTVGYGHAHVPPGTVWTQAQAEAQLIEDVKDHNARLYANAPWIKDLDPVRRRVMENMAFNMGADWVKDWPNTVALIQAGQYEKAANAMQASKWAGQVGRRAVRLIRQMRTGA